MKSAWYSSKISTLNKRLAFEILHDVQEPIVYIWLVCELDLDLVEIAQGILNGNVSFGYSLLYLIETSVFSISQQCHFS
jgi:hypothetical protein